ncbi:molecular chaperone HtpG [Roseivirga echinicomitans]|uniref:Chaperone protein HtpG n=1 Tax=Roseivirga echinicomitans TaxID=296218 RepID=A0A150X176_9BACT|nr:molecular chaperone HtpG [Roseivirga echinicomitans]KYG72489.1 molecular chaperone HtpG [Roseivirga echinicomitans]
MQEKGTISIHTENIFPIIKKFLYSDHEIFLRELVSNAVDASQKMKRLAVLGEYKGDLGEVRVEVSVNKKKKTITISDRGIGMTAEEIKKYINQIAFSGATEFVEKFKDAGDAKEIIGKFGLGFYSAFMVADNVEIDTLSYQEGAEPARWICDGSTEFEITEGTRKERGTTITLHVNKDSVEFLEESRIQNVLTKYAKFLPIEVKFGEKDKQVEDGEDKEGKKKYKTVKEDNIINNTTPLWTKSPNDLTDEDYLNFYKELYPFSEEPLFWIHLNVDYPFELTGILYFPKLKKDFEVQKNKIQLYSRQVFITDETKDVVPEFLMLLHGVIDSPDIPLNVSRSYLQSDGNVKKINTYISKKVADKLSELFKKERESYESKWEDIGLFVKYGMISDEKFYDKAKDFVLVKNTAGKYFTMKEYEAHIEANQVDKDNNKVWLYATNVAKQDSFISDAVDKGYDVIVLDTPIDSHFINHMETKMENTQIKRVDADNIDKLVDKDEKRELVINDEQKEAVKGVFDKAINNKTYTVAIEPLAPSDAPVSVTMPEFMRRMKDMQATGGGGFNMFGSMPDNYNVTVNGNHKLVDKIIKATEEGDKEGLAKQAFDLALLSQGLLEGKALTDFIKRSTAILGE